jgi:D-sedoheptulose 7-phosphate isomerase
MIATNVAARIQARMEERNAICKAFFAREARRLAETCRAMSERFLKGGRLLAFGRGRMRPMRSMCRWSSSIR